MTALASRRWMTAATLGVATGAIVLYWPSLTLPVIFDDLLHIRIAKGLTPVTVWLVNDQFGFYRPFTFVPLLIIHWLFGYYPDWLLHGLNVAQHSLNAVLLTALAWRLWRSQMRALLAGTLFAFFPFSYQAIAVYGHNVHPSTTGLMLLGVHTYLTAVQSNAERASLSRQRKEGRQPAFWWGLTGLIFIMALLSHESAVTFGILAGLVHWNARGRMPRFFTSALSGNLRRPPTWFFFVLIGALYAVAYQLLPLASVLPGASQADESLWIRTLYLLQAAAYPFTWFAHLLPDVDAASLVLASAAMTLLLSLWVGRQRSKRLPLLLGWGWWAVAALVIVVPLSTGYLLHGPRLLYLGSVGLALSWATILTSQDSGTLKVVWPIAGAAFILATNWQFVRGRLADYTRITEPLEVIQEVMSGKPPNEGVFVVNLPQWLAPPRNTFAVGAELVAMLGDHLFASEMVWENLPGEPAVYSVVSSDLLQKRDYPYGVHDETALRGEAAASLPVRSDWAGAGSQVFIVSYEEAGPQTTHTGAFQPGKGVAAPLAYLGPYQLLEVSVTTCKDVVEATFAWRWAFSESILPTASVFVQLLTDDGQLLAQADGPPLGLRSDLIELQPDWQIRDRRTIQVADPDRPLSLLVGAYDYATGERFPAFDSKQTPLQDKALRIAILPCL